jgi:hypothetical protein
MAFEVEQESQTEDHYVITLSFRPQGKFAGEPGSEQFFIELAGTIAHRQVLALPQQRRGRWLLPTIAGLVLMVAAVVVVVAVALSRENSEPSSDIVTSKQKKTPMITTS